MSNYSPAEVFSPDKLAKVDWHQRPDGFADVRLRKNIEKVAALDGESPEQWRADEAYIVLQITESEAEERFEELWEQAVKACMTDEQRIEANEQSTGENQDAVAELGDVVAEQGDLVTEHEAAIAELGDLVASLAGGDN